MNKMCIHNHIYTVTRECFVTFSTVSTVSSRTLGSKQLYVRRLCCFLVGVWRQTVAEHAKCASIASTTSVHPALAPNPGLVQTPPGHAKRDLQCTQSSVRLQQCLRGSVDE